MTASTFVPDRVESPIPWKIGEHIAAVGDTGTGKTFLISELVKARKYVVIFRTKPDDIRFDGFKKVRKAEAMDDVKGNDRILLTPAYERQAWEGWHALERAWRQGNWTIVIDELWYAEKIGLKEPIERLLTQGRSKGISVIIGMQRPAQISRFAISQCTHLFTFRVDGRDADTIKLATTPRIIPAIESLSGHDFAYYNRSRRLVTTGNARRLGALMRIPRGTT